MNEKDKQNNLSEFLSAESERLSSQSLAALIIDAVIDAGLIDKKDSQLAINIVTEEIEVRKALGDY